MATKMTPKDAILACAASLGLTMAAEFVPWSKSRNKGEKHKSLNWIVTLHRNGRAILSTDYSAGEAHCPAYASRRTLDTDERIAFECEHGAVSRSSNAFGPRANGIAILPELADVLCSLSLDSSVIDHPTYETWAAEFGFDPDSRKGEATYRACLKIALELRAGIGDDGMRRLAEACQDY